MTDDLERVKFTDRGAQCWAVKNAAGAAEFRVITATDHHGAITLHSPRPMSCIGEGPCDLLPGGHCWTDATFVGGRDLHRAWVDERRDDEVIWGALESWHADRFGGEPSVVAAEEARPVTTTPAPVPRIRWESADYGLVGYVGTLETWLFTIYKPCRPGDRWMVTSEVPGSRDADSREAAKDAAERWLSGFAVSLGAVFPDQIREAVTAERDKRSKAALAADPEWAAERYFGWVDALDWVLALTDRTAAPAAREGTP